MIEKWLRRWVPPSQREKKFQSPEDNLIFILSAVHPTKGLAETEDNQGKKKTLGEIRELYQQSSTITSRFLVTEASLVETVFGNAFKANARMGITWSPHSWVVNIEMDLGLIRRHWKA